MTPGGRTLAGAEGDGVLGMLRWLGRTPESSVPGHPAPSTPATALPEVPPGLLVRWDVPGSP